MSDILLESAMRGRLERLGAERATFFNWQVSAKATLDVYRDVVEERRTPGAKQAAMAGAGRAGSFEKR
jgi:hypothetical protein